MSQPSQVVCTNPDCGAQAGGNFCNVCGISLNPDPCRSCGTRPPLGARFCIQCGTDLFGHARTAPEGSGFSNAKLGWIMAGVLMVGLMISVAVPALKRGSRPPQQPVSTTSAPGGAVDLSSMTPRQAADRLFNRVMLANEQGNVAEVTQFLPMALQAYEIARPLDADGFFHLALLRRAGRDFDGSRDSALQGLEAEPGHILLLHAAARAAADSGDEEGARDYYRQFMDGFAAEVALDRSGYEDHATLFTSMRADARDYLGGG